MLRSAHKSSGLSKYEVIDMAAAIIEDDIRSNVYDVTNYPKFDDKANGELVPGTLSRLLAGVIKTKSNSPKPVKSRHKAIAHSIISAARPRSFISPYS